MAQLSTSIFLLSLLITLLTLLPTNYGFSRSISKEELGIKDGNNNQTHLTFYFHDIVSGRNPSVIQIARANSTINQSPFGNLAMMDDPLTEGPENTSKLVGRAQGMYGVADQQGPGLLMIMNFYFVEGDFNGSTLSVLGRNHASDGVREMPVVGGTKAFRFAKGYAQARTHIFDPNTGDAVVQYNVFVNHYSSGSNQSDGGSTGSTTSNGAPSSSQASLSKMVSFSSFITMIPLLYLCLF
ncbi:pterocarpan synthase 1 [Beta vulgaris subsp. vulgaris]|uniref:pterocarpan synthase 1 n=1 Tax=Beta vulgaris subsp. vulgaris TaxID=3555 RepID=UPI0020370AC3|nr:pterocarpan synthase 1 [Beta vulgaris subsp. vulgaris]